MKKFFRNVKGENEMKNNFEILNSELSMYQRTIETIIRDMENIYNSENYVKDLERIYNFLHLLPEWLDKNTREYFYEFFDEVIIYYEGEEILDKLKKMSEEFDMNYIDIFFKMKKCGLLDAVKGE